jgi:hypothetical protein
LILIFLFSATVCTAKTLDSGSIIGRVENEAGKPFSGVTVTATSKSGSEKKTSTGSDGRFSISLEEGEYSVTLSASGYTTISYPVTLAAGNRFEIKTVRMTKETRVSKIRGKVYTDDGIAIPGATLVIERTDPGKTLKITRQTNSSGEFAFQLPGEAAHYRITASMKGFKPDIKDTDVDAGEVRSMAFKLSK